jgi:hypothetical protein
LVGRRRVEPTNQVPRRSTALNPKSIHARPLRPQTRVPPNGRRSGAVGYQCVAGASRADAVRSLSGWMSVRGRILMLWTIFVILLVLWLLGFVTGNTFGGLVHILIVVAVIVLVLQLLRGRRG